MEYLKGPYKASASHEAKAASLQPRATESTREGDVLHSNFPYTSWREKMSKGEKQCGVPLKTQIHVEK